MTTSKAILATDLIPQKAPFVFVDLLLDIASTSWNASFVVPENHVFVVDGELLKAGYIEVLAQSVAAGITMLNSDSDPKVGFIGEIRGFKIHRAAKVNEELEIFAEIEREVFGVLIISGKISCKGAIVAEGSLKLVLQNQEDN
ncbi:MAG: hypothetical protein JKY54_11410 [Flavobacteriales bacterium]|nr:hypothetical protein [Flavobacteriales bacterium]